MIRELEYLGQNFNVEQRADMSEKDIHVNREKGKTLKAKKEIETLYVDLRH